MGAVRVDQLAVGDEVRGLGRVEHIDVRDDGAWVLEFDQSADTVTFEPHNEVERIGHEHRVLALDAPTTLMVALTHLLAGAPPGAWEVAATRNRELVDAMPDEAPPATRAACTVFQRILDAGAEMCRIQAEAPPEAFEFAEQMQRGIYEEAAERDGHRIIVPEDGPDA